MGKMSKGSIKEMGRKGRNTVPQKERLRVTEHIPGKNGPILLKWGCPVREAWTRLPSCYI